MEEDITATKSEGTRRKQNTYSTELKLALLEEYRNTRHTTSIAKFVRDHNLCLATFYGWMKKAGVRALPQKVNAVDVRSIIPAEAQETTMGCVRKPDAMITIMINGNEIQTTREGVEIIVSSLIRC